MSSDLTRREKEILLLIANGLTNNEIAEKLFLSSETIKTHRKNMMRKLELSNTAGLVKYAVENSQTLLG
jgi:DNA-binding CsgD family transcriptional regulator